MGAESMNIMGLFHITRVPPRRDDPTLELLRGIYLRQTQMALNIESLKDALVKLNTDMTAALDSQRNAIAALQAKLDAGDTATQADIDALTASVTAMDAMVAGIPTPEQHTAP